MTTHEVIVKRLLSLCQEHHTNPHALAKMAGIPSSSIKNILYGKSQNTGVITIKKLCDGLDITLGEFFNTEEFNELEQEIK
ncbi:MAG: helix-turn-helix transcriptional regulator [Oscillospiraceae bacterium]|nr:helix-turn-helix transcriptional regulator [Oscillospiraceae bacterium]